MKLDRNIYEVLRILGSSLLDKEPIRDLLAPEQGISEIANCYPMPF